MSDPGGRSGKRERVGAGLTAFVVVVQGLVLAWWYPNAHLDADLLSYLAYYRDWAAGAATPFGYTVPKVLPVALFGPTASPEASFLLSLTAAAAGGAFVFLLAGRLFGPAVAILAATTYVFDPLRSILTLRSSADLFVGVALLGAMCALSRRAVVWAGVAVLVASLAKPLALVCGLAILLVPGVSRVRRFCAACVPLFAIPAVAALEAALEGEPILAGVFALALPNDHTAFVRVAQGPPLGWLESLEMLFVDWFGLLLFARTWPLVIIGALLYVARTVISWRDVGDVETRARSGRLDGQLVVLSVPLLMVGAYVALAVLDPFVFFTRFFWILSAALTILAAYGAIAVTSYAPLPAWGRSALLGIFALALLADRFDDFAWRKQLMLDPFETHAPLAGRGVELIADDARCSGEAVVPLAYLPLAAWRAPEKLRRGELCATEDWAAGRGCLRPTCVLVMPAAPTTDVAREASNRLLQAGWAVEFADENGALVRQAPAVPRETHT